MYFNMYLRRKMCTMEIFESKFHEFKDISKGGVMHATAPVLLW